MHVIKSQMIKRILISALLFVVCLVYRMIGWTHLTLAGMTLDKIVFELNVPMKGVNKDTVWSAVSYCLLPAAAVTLLVFLLLYLNDNIKGRKIFNIRFGKSASKPRQLQLFPIVYLKTASLVLCLVFLTVSVIKANTYFELFNYIDSQIHTSTFIEDNYISPDKVKLTFPEQKRNLIYIYLESMESTYADTASGGAFDENYIPELKDLADQNINFSSTELLGGALPVAGTQWTIGALFSSSTGLPLLLPIDGNSMSEYAEFFPGVISIGDILNRNGYHNVFFIGSDADFGGRRLYYTQHGNYEICDYNDAKEKGLIPSDYNVWWGYEDEKLFSFAKAKLLELGQSGQPFNFTMLTADTHFPDGYVCPLCSDTYGSQYADVIACSSKQVYHFVQWIQQQDFYDNTTIVITGDHETMNTELCDKIPDAQRSVYDCFINAVPAISAEDAKNRQFSSLDLYPTVLASIGVQIDGDQLGLGVNLFSGRQTLYEKNGAEISDELRKKSAFYNNTFIYDNG